VAETKIAYSASTALTWTAAIASSTTAARECTAVDNTTTLYDDVRVMISIQFPNSAPANDKTVYIYAAGYDSTLGYGGSPALTGTDAAITLDAAFTTDPPAMRLAASCWMVQNKTRVFEIPSLASVFGGVLPPKWGLVLVNYSGQTLTAVSARYVGITYTVA
jgi:hypothetical protein